MGAVWAVSGLGVSPCASIALAQVAGQMMLHLGAPFDLRYRGHQPAPLAPQSTIISASDNANADPNAQAQALIAQGHMPAFEQPTVVAGPLTAATSSTQTPSSRPTTEYRHPQAPGQQFLNTSRSS